MFIDGLTNADSIPVLETVATVAAQRQKYIQSNIANFSTPTYQPKDIDVHEFQKTLGDAIDNRRRRHGGFRGDLELRTSRQIDYDGPRGGRLRIRPTESGRNILFHDRNNRDVERSMQDLAENVAAFRVTTELLRSRIELLRSAIRERV